jgi:hypothetical protein
VRSDSLYCAATLSAPASAHMHCCNQGQQLCEKHSACEAAHPHTHNLWHPRNTLLTCCLLLVPYDQSVTPCCPRRDTHTPSTIYRALCTLFDRMPSGSLVPVGKGAAPSCPPTAQHSTPFPLLAPYVCCDRTPAGAMVPDGKGVATLDAWLPTHSTTLTLSSTLFAPC